MGGFSNCCCGPSDSCCAAATVPPGWEQISPCCFRKASPIATGVDYFCSPAFRRCRKQASLTTEYWKWRANVIECTASNRAGLNAFLEEVQGYECMGEQFLCGRSRYTIDRTIELYMAGYFEKPEVVTYATRVNCGGTCKWLFQSIYSKGVNYDIVIGGKQKYQLEALYEYCCEFFERLIEDDTLGCYQPEGATYTEGRKTFQACGQAIRDEFPEEGESITFSNTGASLCEDGAEFWQTCFPQCEFGDCPWVLNNPIPQEHTILLDEAIGVLCRNCNLTPSCTNNDQIVSCVNWVHWVDPETGNNECHPVLSFSGTRSYKTLTINNEACLDFALFKDEFGNDLVIGPFLSGDVDLTACASCPEDRFPPFTAQSTASSGDTLCTDFTYSITNESLDGSVSVPCPESWSVTV